MFLRDPLLSPAARASLFHQHSSSDEWVFKKKSGCTLRPSGGHRRGNRSSGEHSSGYSQRASGRHVPRPACPTQTPPTLACIYENQSDPASDPVHLLPCFSYVKRQTPQTSCLKNSQRTARILNDGTQGDRTHFYPGVQFVYLLRRDFRVSLTKPRKSCGMIHGDHTGWFSPVYQHKFLPGCVHCSRQVRTHAVHQELSRPRLCSAICPIC